MVIKKFRCANCRKIFAAAYPEFWVGSGNLVGIISFKGIIYYLHARCPSCGKPCRTMANSKEVKGIMEYAKITNTLSKKR